MVEIPRGMIISWHPSTSCLLLPSIQVCNPDEHLHFLSNYLTELSLLDYNMLGFLPSVIAAAGIFLANLILKRTPWDANLRHFSAYVPADISSCVVALASVHQAVSSSTQLAAIRDKYAHARFHEVSRLPPFAITSFGVAVYS
jgi:cyclin A